MALPACVTASKKGSKILGVPVGTEPFVVAYARAKPATAIKQLRLLSLLENHQSATLVLRLSFSPRPRFLASVLPVAAMQPVFTEWDTEMRSVLASLFKGPVPPRVFGTGAGLGGVIVMADEHPFIRGLLRNSAAMGTLFPSLARLASVTNGSTHPVHTDAADTWEALPDAPRNEILEKVKLRSGGLIELHTLDAGQALPLLDANTFASKSWTRERIFLSLDPLGQLIMAMSSQPGARTLRTAG